MENQDQTPSLDGLLSEEVEQAPSNETEEFLARIIEMISTVSDSVANLHMVNRSLVERVGTLERFVAYMMSKDPEMGPKMKAMADAAEKKADDQVL